MQETLDWCEPRCADFLAWQLGLDISHFQLTAMNCRTALMLPKSWKNFNIPKRPVQFLERGKKKFLKDYHTKSEIDTRNFFGSLLIPVVWNAGKWWFCHSEVSFLYMAFY